MQLYEMEDIEPLLLLVCELFELLFDLVKDDSGKAVDVRIDCLGRDRND
jgi:hypothetical protein